MIVSKNLKIVAAGRGRSISLPSIAEAVLSLISATTTSINFVYLGTATYDKEEAFLIQTEAYRKLRNCQVMKLDVSEAVDNIPSEQEIRDTILSAHAILVSGGNTLYAVNRWKELKIDQFIRQAVEENQSVLCGGSAGAICWFDYGHSDSMDPTTFLYVDPNLTEEQKSNWEYIRVEGLGYIPALCVPHHDTIQSNGVPRSEDSDAMQLKYPDQISIGIDENAALIVTDGRARVISADGNAGCVLKKVVTSQNGPAVIERIPFTHDHGSVRFDLLLEGRIR
ncbi:hypothetical protein FisN_1Lh189 [Fistulifera solaris]|uniref:Cyanophycinase n=1 Tax=Fistulifera solaris TaxID=1519565 RepID=A0A1Z5K4I4_FISSO|nr:hypothetical protein FisN_1Lh189 [Fistulifera solaris]|eukprot:GAX21135.1 hypothetical protein FisN_1Lh189 [Fistulifera solaris]